jgi:hypothetical protein
MHAYSMRVSPEASVHRTPIDANSVCPRPKATRQRRAIRRWGNRWCMGIEVHSIRASRPEVHGSNIGPFHCGLNADTGQSGLGGSSLRSTVSSLVVPFHPTESEASVRGPKWLVAASILLHPRPGEEMRCFQERRGVGIGLRLSDGRVEVRGRVESHVVVLGDHASEEPRSGLIANVPALEERLFDHRHHVPHRRVVGREAHRRVGDDVELLARGPGANFGRAHLVQRTDGLHVRVEVDAAEAGQESPAAGCPSASRSRACRRRCRRPPRRCG